MSLLDPHRVALLSDLHISADAEKSERGVIMTDNLRRVVDAVLTPDASGRLPSCVIVNGDCAHHTGELADYAHLLTLLAPIVDAGVPIHLGVGNHDRRDHLLQSIDIARVGNGVSLLAVPGRHVILIPTERADFLLLDSLDVTNGVPGVLGDPQLAWLEQTLVERSGSPKPLVVLLHHNLERMLEVQGVPGNGINGAETERLLSLLNRHREVKALLFGHTHRWERGLAGDLHLVNLPAVAYVFREQQPSGWIDCHLRHDGASLTLRCVDPQSPGEGQTIDLAWRTLDADA